MVPWQKGSERRGRGRVGPTCIFPAPQCTQGYPSSSNRRMLERREFKFYSGTWEPSNLCALPKHIVNLNLYGQNFTSEDWSSRARPCAVSLLHLHTWAVTSLLSLILSPILQCTCVLLHFGSRGIGISSLSLVLPAPQCYSPIILSAWHKYF